jgi:hypothetical protein
VSCKSTVKIAAVMSAVVLCLGSAGWSGAEKSTGLQSKTNISAQRNSGKEPAPVVDKKNVSKYVGKRVSVRFLVDHVHDCHSGKVYLNESHDYAHCFAAIIPGSRRKRFAADLSKSYKGKAVQVTGIVELDFGTPKVVVAGPDQVQVMK